MYNGAPLGPGDPALLDDTWKWTELAAELGWEYVAPTSLSLTR